jgi:hypothetical protein
MRAAMVGASLPCEHRARGGHGDGSGLLMKLRVARPVQWDPPMSQMERWEGLSGG